MHDEVFNIGSLVFGKLLSIRKHQTNISVTGAI